MYRRSLHGPLEDLRSKLGLPAGSSWEDITPAAMLALQKAGGVQPMVPSGRFDPSVALNTGYYRLEGVLTSDQAAYVAGSGAKPGTIMRDITASSAQVPRWAWLLIGFGLMGVGGFMYYRARKASKVK